MKKVSSIIAVAITAMLMCVSCEKSSEKNIVGKWENTKIEYEGKSYTFAEFQKYATDSGDYTLIISLKALEGMSFEFKSDKTCIVTTMKMPTPGTWSMSGSDVTISSGGQGAMILKNKDGKLIYTFSMPSLEKTITFDMIFEKK